jgi:hypothetical protein
MAKQISGLPFGLVSRDLTFALVVGLRRREKKLKRSSWPSLRADG